MSRSARGVFLKLINAIFYGHFLVRDHSFKTSANFYDFWPLPPYHRHYSKMLMKGIFYPYLLWPFDHRHMGTPLPHAVVLNGLSPSSFRGRQGWFLKFHQNKTKKKIKRIGKFIKKLGDIEILNSVTSKMASKLQRSRKSSVDFVINCIFWNQLM